MPQLTQVWYRYEVSSKEEKKRTGSVFIRQLHTGKLVQQF